MQKLRKALGLETQRDRYADSIARSNLVASVEDDRDYIYVPKPGPYPQIVDWRNRTGEIEDQLEIGSCVGNAVCSGGEFHRTDTDLSRLFVYYNSRELENRIGQEGTSIRNALKVSRSLGICNEVTWPYITSQDDVRPSSTAYAEGAQQILHRYEKVFDDRWLSMPEKWNSIIPAIADGLPIVFGITLGRQFFGLKGPLDAQNYVPQNSINNPAVGNHAMLVVGYVAPSNSIKHYLIVENSWGTKHGDNGYVAIPFGCMVDVFEARVIRSFFGSRIIPVLTDAQRKVIELYVALFGRAPEWEGLQYWAYEVAMRGAQSVANSMYACDPARAYYPLTLTDSEFVVRVYQHVLGREPDYDGLQYLTARARAVDRGTLVVELLSAVSYYNGADPGAIQSKMRFVNRVQVGAYFGAALRSGNVESAALVLVGVSHEAATVQRALTLADSLRG